MSLTAINSNKKPTNPCIRCGKERVFSRSWTEQITTFSGNTIEISHTENVCPDEECQKLLEKEFAVQKEKRQKIALDKQQRADDKKALQQSTLIRKSLKKIG